MSERVIRTWLSRSWWVIFPSFTLLVVRLSMERSCADANDLLPGVSSSPRWALSLALLYVLAHVWAVAAYFLVTVDARALVPGVAALRRLPRADRLKLALMVIALLIEYAPMPIWRLMGQAVRCVA